MPEAPAEQREDRRDSGDGDDPLEDRRADQPD
jgi:hypothetical protein